MIENTIDSNARFRALYYRQRVLEGDVMLSSELLSDFENNWPLQLTPLSMITDEHAREFFKICGAAISEYGILTVESPLEKLKSYISAQIYFRHDLYNFLISKGYYVGDGTELEYKWAVLKIDK